MSLSIKLLSTLISAFIIAKLTLPIYIKKITKRSLFQSINLHLTSVGQHAKKIKTPTAGGIFIILSAIIPTLFFSKTIGSTGVLLIASLISFGILGFIDDYKKISLKNHFGLTPQTRMIAEIIIASIIVIAANKINADINEYSNTLIIGSYKIKNIYFYSFLRIFAIVGSANAVNITDGLDGLVSMPAFFCFTFTLIFACLIATNSTLTANYPHIHNPNSIYIISAALCGSILGFLWLNSAPAQIFMGDVGSLAIGGILSTMCIIMKCEIFLILIGIIYVIETTSCIIQIGYYKRTKKRVFLMTPIHHHFEKQGIPETKIVLRFWIISIISFITAISIIFIN
ncbi:phospho-N-acetylmuramoyl-pentapeptide-transferase [Rickettsiales bacterium]|nr:phospho-N-acetylmuramoyl-pentapeptide-transferase [Rickettsiales bacterium]